MPAFDAYLIVDWSASSTPVRGADSIWYCLLSRSDAGLSLAALKNPSTRCQAAAEIKAILHDTADRGQHVLAGFDFPYGYPAGFASALGVGQAAAWRSVWQEIASNIIDRDDNSNNRFEIAADFNRRISGACHPFWGCPQRHVCSTMSSARGRPEKLPEKRITDVGTMQSIWKLYGIGSVGSQALLGIPYVMALCYDSVLRPLSSIWPFETGLSTLPSRQNRNWLILHAEIYPSLLRVRPATGEVKDAAQVRRLAAHFAALDEAGQLADLFGGSPSLTAAEREIVECEEGWTLGVGVGLLPSMRRLEIDPLFTRRPEASIRLTARPNRTGASRATEPGFENRNRQTVIRTTGLAGTDHGQYVYVLRCGACGHEYGANGSDIFQRRCPRCQGGKPGLPY